MVHGSKELPETSEQAKGASCQDNRQGGSAYQDAREDFRMLGIHAPRGADVLQVAVQEGAHDAGIVHHESPHDLASLISQLLKSDGDSQVITRLDDAGGMPTLFGGLPAHPLRTPLDHLKLAMITLLRMIPT